MPENNIELAGNTNIKTSQVDKSVDTPADFTSPEVLYNKLIETIRQYHPSSDLSDIESLESHILFTHCVLPLY